MSVIKITIFEILKNLIELTVTQEIFIDTNLINAKHLILRYHLMNQTEYVASALGLIKSNFLAMTLKFTGITCGLRNSDTFSKNNFSNLLV